MEFLLGWAFAKGPALDGGGPHLYCLGNLEEMESQGFNGVAALPSRVFQLILEEMRLRKAACGDLDLAWL